MCPIGTPKTSNFLALKNRGTSFSRQLEQLQISTASSQPPNLKGQTQGGWKDYQCVLPSCGYLVWWFETPKIWKMISKNSIYIYIFNLYSCKCIWNVESRLKTTMWQDIRITLYLFIISPTLPLNPHKTLKKKHQQKTSSHENQGFFQWHARLKKGPGTMVI